MMKKNNGIKNIICISEPYHINILLTRFSFKWNKKLNAISCELLLPLLQV